MNRPYEQKPTLSQIERKIAYADFILTILDDRHKIEEALLSKSTTIAMAFNGHRCESYDTPEVLDHYLQPFSSITVDLTATRDQAGINSIDRVAVYPEDSSPFILQRAEDCSIIYRDDEEHLLPLEALESTLRQLLPYTARSAASLGQVLEFIGESSPESNYSIGFVENVNGHQHEILLSKTETLNDSIETLEVTRYTPHASGAQIGTRMHLSESVSHRRENKKPDHTEHELVIEALQQYEVTEELTVETILNTNGRTVTVDTATRRHINDITCVLDTLK